MENARNELVNKEHQESSSNSVSVLRTEKLECKKCHAKFSDKNIFKNHIKTNHHKSHKCEYCDEIFSDSYQMESHLVNVHKKIKTHKCNECEASFMMEWRLKKHIKSHSLINVRACHYFNNSDFCPFSEIGCKFRHVKANLCNFGENCKSKRCQYRHK